MTKKQKLLNLRSRIIDEVYKTRWEEVWFFPRFEKIPEIKDVKGFLGTKPIFFVSINPSSGQYPTKKDKAYYRSLVEHGFSDAHLTDCFKIKKVDNTNIFKNEEYISEAIGILREEISIIAPKMIVLLGREAQRFFENHRSDIKYGGVVKSIPHYSQRIPRYSRQFTEEIQNVRNEYVKIL